MRRLPLPLDAERTVLCEHNETEVLEELPKPFRNFALAGSQFEYRLPI